MPTPESYGSVEDADGYHAARGHAAWAGISEPDKEAALVRATLYIDGFRERFPGRRAEGRDQSLEWPRRDAADAEGNPIADDEVPVEILAATYEAALIEALTPGRLSPVVIEADRVKREKVGELETEYADSVSSTSGVAAKRPQVTAIEDILSKLLGARRASVRYLKRV